MLSICAVIAVRNEAAYLRVLLPILAAQGIEAVVIDNGSTDGSRELCEQRRQDPVIRLESIRYQGYFSLSEQLEAKQKVYRRLQHDWIIHHDADEVFEHEQPGRTLRNAIEEADSGGCTALNFNEFVFLPEAGSDHSGQNYYETMLRYYFFEPRPTRMNRAWKRKASLSSVASGGHTLSGDQVRIWPVNHIFRHYIVLSYEHAKAKYLHRTFDPRDLARGWHGNRMSFTEDNLRLPAGSSYLFTLDAPGCKDFHTERPTPKHYWEWQGTEAP